jgi:hypothetical protein
MMKHLLGLIAVVVLLSGCGTSTARLPAAAVYDDTSYILIQSISVDSPINTVEQGYAIFLRVTSVSSASGTGAVVRYPEDGFVVALEPDQDFPLSPLMQIPNRSDVMIEVSVFALPHDTTLEALNILSYALPAIGKAFAAQAPIAPVLGALLGGAAEQTKEALQEGRMVAYYQASASTLAAAPLVITDELRLVSRLVTNQGGGATVLEPYEGQTAEPSAEEPFFMQRLVYAADLEGKTAWELDVLRNEIYARHGRGFNRQDLQRHFDAQPWYKRKYSPEAFNDALLTPLQRQNALFIREYQLANNLD